MIIHLILFIKGGPAEQKTVVGAMVATINGSMTRYTSLVQMKQKHELSTFMAIDFKG